MNRSQVKLSDTPAAIKILITNKPIPIRAPMQGLETLWPPRWNDESKENLFRVGINSIFRFQFSSKRKNIRNALYLVNKALNNGDDTSKDRVKSKHNIVDFYWNQLGIVLIKIQLLKSYKICNRPMYRQWFIFFACNSPKSITWTDSIQNNPQLYKLYNVNPTTFNDKKSKFKPTTL